MLAWLTHGCINRTRQNHCQAGAKDKLKAMLRHKTRMTENKVSPQTPFTCTL
jgi:hypothetical protein